jgi:uncharacterized Zn finger protein
MAEKKIKCPWCGIAEAPIKENKVHGGKVVERRCGACGQVLAAYAADEGNFLPKIRVFKNS